MKLQYLLKSFVEECQAILDYHNVSITDPNLDHGESGLKVMHQLHTKICQDRAYDNTHPFYVSGRWTRILPFDGRVYCFTYLDENGNETCNDDHVNTLLRATKRKLK